MYISQRVVAKVIDDALAAVAEGDLAKTQSLLRHFKDQLPDTSKVHPMKVLTSAELDQCYQTDIDTHLYDLAKYMDSQ